MPCQYNVSAMPTFLFIKGGEGMCAQGNRPHTKKQKSLSLTRTRTRTHGALFSLTVVDRLMGANPERLQELINEHK
jgi:hypothetical protein